jgi:ubiquinone/menaquinone biosynthesis C-methylase UbiE
MKTPPMRRQIKWVPGGHVLDVGCGNGEMLDQYRALGWRTTGVEPGPESAELARSKGHSIITGLVEDLGLPAESFDAITLWDALEHIPNPQVVLRELYRILVPGGRIYIHVPNYGSTYARLWQDRWFMFTAPLHYFHYSAATLSTLLARTGFSEIDPSTGLGEVGWRQSLLSGVPKQALRRRLLNGRLAIKMATVIEQALPGGHLTVVAAKPAVMKVTE